MSRLRIVRLVTVAIVACCSLTGVASAGAAAWQGPQQLSEAGLNVGGANAHIALGAGGDAGAAWWDEGAGGRFVLARKRAGGPWSAPVTLVSGVPQTPIFVGVDGSGDITAAYTGAASTWFVANWPAGAATPTSTPLPLVSPPLNITALAVNANGDAVLSGLSGTAAAIGVVLGYRHGFAGSFALHPYNYPVNGFAASTARVAINGSGMAIAMIVSGTALWAATRTSGADWPPSAAGLELVTTNAITTTADSADPSVTIDGSGNAFAAFTYTLGSAVVLRTSLRPASGGWQESPDLSSVTANFTASFVNVVVNPGGTALLAWEESSTTGFGNIQARAGSTGTGIWGPIETVNDAGADQPLAAIGNDGMGMATWERALAISSNIGQGRVRNPGTAGIWSDIHNFSSLHANFNKPSLATDGIGDFAVLSAPHSDALGYNPALVSVYDAAPPSTTPIVSSGTGLAGDPMMFSETASDAWSTVGVPTWTFGDGATGTGASVTHTYAAAGTFPVHVTVTDSSGNTTGRDASVTVVLAQSALTTTRFSAKWKVSRVRGTLLVGGSAPRAGAYVIDVTKGKKRRIHVSYTLPAGVFSKKLKLPPTLVPGSYHVALLPAATNVRPSARDVRLAAPASGVVDVAFLSGARNGTAARTLTGATTIWASFHFAAKPKGKLLLTWYRLGKKRVRLGATSKDSAVKVVSYLRSAQPFVGTYQAVLTRKGVVIARATVKAKKG